MKSKEHFSRLMQLSVQFPIFTISVFLVLIAAFATGIPKIVKDPSVDAFIPEDHPVVLARDRAAEVFGIEDPIVIGLVAEQEKSVFTPEALTALRQIELAARNLTNVDKTRLTSIVSENWIAGDDGNLRVDPVLEEGPVTEASAATAWIRSQSMPVYMGLLVSRSGDAINLIVPVHDPNNATDTYNALVSIVEHHSPPTVSGYVAGVAAMNARLATLVDQNTRIFIPGAILAVLAVLFLALRQLAALIGPVIVIAGSGAIMMGLLGWLDSRYYLITTTLPVVVMALAVADSLHIIVRYLEIRGQNPDLSAREGAATAIRKTFIPVTITTVTTAGGFFGLAVGAHIIPIAEFGMFAIVGVMAAWLLSLTLLPAILVITNLQPIRVSNGSEGAGWARYITFKFTEWALHRPYFALSTTVLIVGTMLVFSFKAEFNYQRADFFPENDPIQSADAILNERLDGLNFLDVVITAPTAAGILSPDALDEIANLAEEVKNLSLVERVSGLHNYISIMHRSLTGSPAGTLPTRSRAAAQYMLLYESSAQPEDFQTIVDYDYRRTLLRAQLKTDEFIPTQQTVQQLRSIIDEYNAVSPLQYEISGRVAVNAGWMSALQENHFPALGLSVFIIFTIIVLTLRSTSLSLVAMLPVIAGVLAIYGIMGAFGIDIATATSMTAAIAAGLGVDFGVHLLNHVRQARKQGLDLRAALAGDYHVVARACLYSGLALLVGLSVLTFSAAPPLRWFGLLIAAAIAGCLIGALLLVPSVVSVLHRFTNGADQNA